MEKRNKYKRVLVCLLSVALIMTTAPAAAFADVAAKEDLITKEDLLKQFEPDDGLLPVSEDNERLDQRISPIDEREIIREIEEENQGADRFIIKYKDAGFDVGRFETIEVETSIIADIDIKLRQAEEKIERQMVEKTELRVSQDIADIRELILEEIQPARPERARVIDTAVIESENIAVFTMSQGITEEEFVEAVNSIAGSREIEYIQPG